MAILAKCPVCKHQQSIKNKTCKCGTNLDTAKRSRTVKYYVTYRLPDGKQRKEFTGFKLKDARDLSGKRSGELRENKIFDVLPEIKITFSELGFWYLDLESVKKLASYGRVKTCLKNFNSVYGKMKVGSISLKNLEDYQALRLKQGKARSTIDTELTITKSAILKAFYNDLIDGKALKPFNRIKPLLKVGENARRRTLSFAEYIRLRDVSPKHLKACITISYNTGMRKGEIRLLKWSYIDRGKSMIRLPKEITKERKSKIIPINYHVKAVLDSLPRTLPPNDFVITFKGRPIIAKDGLKMSFKHACGRANIIYGRLIKDGLIFHDIRRTVKTNMVRAGVDATFRDLILGHALQGMDKYYISLSETDLTEAMQKYTTYIDQKLELESGNVSRMFHESEKKRVASELIHGSKGKIQGSIGGSSKIGVKGKGSL